MNQHKMRENKRMNQTGKLSTPNRLVTGNSKISMVMKIMNKQKYRDRISWTASF